jgi:tRNA 5-methylaminomethyl-2-thiouridine biosynthesis bifunctional protein
MTGARGLPQRRILDTSFGKGLALLAAWRAWKDDPQRPRILHYVAITEQPATVAQLLSAAQSSPEFQPLAEALVCEWYGLLPGVHRLVFEDGRVLLTLCIGDTERMLRQLDFHADAVLLHGDAAIHLKALARCCRRGTTIEASDPAGTLRPALRRHGFALGEAGGGWLRGEFAPAWEPRGPQPKEEVTPGTCIVIGAGLAGAAAAASMARRGWGVRVLDGAPTPASGASGLPAGMLVPHSSPDDNLLSRLSRDGVRATLQQAQAWLTSGQDFEASGVLEHHLDGTAARPAVSQAAAAWNRPADAPQKQLAGLEADASADWHEKAGWIRPARLVQAWLAQPGIQLQCDARVVKLRRVGSGWQALAADGRLLASGEMVIVAAAVDSQTLVDGLTLQPVRGQVTWKLHDGPLRLPPFPVNGDGSFIPSVPTGQGPAWMCGASFDRGDCDLRPRVEDQQANLARLRRLLPRVAREVESATTPQALQAWTGIRCASTDRRPLVGQVDEEAPGGLWLSTAMGSRGLTFAALAAELIAARVHGEPLPLARNLARALSPARHKNRAATRANAGE